MAVTVQSTKGYMQRGGVKMMIYGKRGVGKTPIIAELPKVLIIASEDGLASVRNKNVDFIEMKTMAQIKEVMAWLRSPSNIAKYDTIAHDGISYLTHAVFSEIARKATHNNKVQYYGELASQIMPFVELLTNEIQKNVIMTAWQGDLYHPVTEKIIGHEPYTAGKAIANYLMHFFDLTAHMQRHAQNIQQADGTVVQQQIPYLQTVEANGIFARSRKEGCLDAFEPADLLTIINKLKQP